MIIYCGLALLFQSVF